MEVHCGHASVATTGRYLHQKLWSALFFRKRADVEGRNLLSYNRTGLRYPADLTDTEWELARPFVDVAQRRPRQQRRVKLREVEQFSGMALGVPGHEDVCVGRLNRSAASRSSASAMRSTTSMPAASPTIPVVAQTTHR